jgi:hypothetical protein
MVGPLGRVISPSQGLYLHNTERQGTNIHAMSGIRTHDLSSQPTKTHTSELTATVTGILVSSTTIFYIYFNNLTTTRVLSQIQQNEGLIINEP